MLRWSDFPNLVHGYSEAIDGTMAINGGFENRQHYLAQHGLRPAETVHAGLCHGTNIVVVTASDGGTIIPDTDGLITAEPNVGLAMTAADCLLISAYDPKRQVIGMVHAGRRGLAAEILLKFFQGWIEAFPSIASDCLVSISPGICADHYTVSKNDAAAFAQWPDACQKRDYDFRLDLRSVARQQLLTAGVQEGKMMFDSRCTFEDHALYSYRRDHPITPQLQVGYIVRKSEIS